MSKCCTSDKIVQLGNRHNVSNWALLLDRDSYQYGGGSGDTWYRECSGLVASIAGLIPQVLRLQAQVMLASLGVGRVREYHVRVYQCVSAVRAVEVPVFVCLRDLFIPQRQRTAQFSSASRWKPEITHIGRYYHLHNVDLFSCITLHNCTFLRDCADMLQVRLRLMAADEPTTGCGATLRCLCHDGDWHNPPLHSPCLLHAYPFQPSGGAV